MYWMAGAAVGQYPSPPGSPWGGYTIQDSAPVGAPVATQFGQPAQAYTLPPQVALPPQPTVVTNPNPNWQTYPGPGAMPVSAPAVTVPLGSADPTMAIPPSAGGPPSLLPPGTRNGVFQKAKFTATWLPQLDDDGLGWTDLRSEIVFGLPFFTRETPIVITPAYEAHFLDRPSAFDLPPRLHDLSIDFHHFRRIGDHWIADFALTPGLYADDHSLDSSDAFRLNGRAVGVYEPNQMWKWLLGVSYVNGGWRKIVPIAGFVYEPSDDVEYEIVFPAPRAAWRLPNSPIPGEDEYWVYVAGEFTSSIWAFEQNDGTDDILAYRDLRLILGFEHKVIGGLSSRAEVGYVFNRQMKIASSGPDDIDLDETLLLRIGLVY
jgi:hypothetical protein